MHADDRYELISYRAVNGKPLILNLQPLNPGLVQPVPPTPWWPRHCSTG